MPETKKGPKRKMVRAEATVFCLTHGDVHRDTTDPFDYGEPDCSKEDHRAVYWRTRVGDDEEKTDGR